MAFDYKKEYKEVYVPKMTPTIIEIPNMNYIAVQGCGNPNEEGGEYKKAIELLYKIAYSLKMSYKTDYEIEGFFQYVVPPLEGLWWQEGSKNFEKNKKEEFHWISMIRLPEFITVENYNWAISEAGKKSDIDYSKVEFFKYDEGLCVQSLHKGSYDSEGDTIMKLISHAEENGYVIDESKERLHHEIYLSDPRRSKPENLKTVIRLPIREK